MKEYQEFPSNWRSQKSLAHYLREAHVPGVEGIDTRALTRHIRQAGAMRAALSTLDLDPDSLVSKARQSPAMTGLDLVMEVTGKEPLLWKDGRPVRLERGLDGFRVARRAGQVARCGHGLWCEVQHPPFSGTKGMHHSAPACKHGFSDDQQARTLTAFS